MRKHQLIQLVYLTISVCFFSACNSSNDDSQSGDTDQSNILDPALDVVNGTYLSSESIFDKDGVPISTRLITIDYQNNTLTTTQSFEADIEGGSSSTIYNEVGLPTSVTETDGNGAETDSTTFNYDENNQLTNITTNTPMSSTPQVTTFEYDILGRITRILTEDQTDPGITSRSTATYSYTDDGLLDSKLIEHSDTNTDMEEVFSDADLYSYDHNDLAQITSIDIDLLNDGSIDLTNNLIYNDAGNLVEQIETLSGEVLRTTRYEYMEAAEAVYNERLWVNRFIP